MILELEWAVKDMIVANKRKRKGPSHQYSERTNVYFTQWVWWTVCVSNQDIVNVSLNIWGQIQRFWEWNQYNAYTVDLDLVVCVSKPKACTWLGDYSSTNPN